MNYIRLIAFLLVIGLSFTLFYFTSDYLRAETKLGLDLKGGFEILYEATPIDDSQTVTDDSLKETASSLLARISKATGGVAEPEITVEGKDRIRVKLAVQKNAQEVRDILKKPAALTFRSGPQFEQIELLGSDFKENAAKVYFDEAGQPGVEIEVKDAKKLETVSQKLLNQPLAIYLDDEELSAPIVRAVISNGKATISGSYRTEEAKKLANTINLGALPLKLTEKYSQSVGATLGEASLKQTLWAGILATIVILIFMLVFYRLPGLVAAFTLIAYVWLLLLVFNWMNATLTLPGIAAFILGIGMAVYTRIL